MSARLRNPDEPRVLVALRSILTSSFVRGSGGKRLPLFEGTRPGVCTLVSIVWFVWFGLVRIVSPSSAFDSAFLY
jgi:hypothetical protein